MLNTNDPPKKKGRRRPKGKSTKKPAYAAVDLGTNNCRLLIAEPQGKRFRVVDSYSQIVRLGEGVSTSGRLADEAMERTVSALKDIRQKIKEHKVKKVRCVATQACRSAENGRAFIERVQKETGLTLKMISPKEEAQLAVIGSFDLIDPKKNVSLVVDIGGGSTELCWVDAKKARQSKLNDTIDKLPVIAWASFPIGVVTMSERFPEHDRGDWYDSMVAHARDTMLEFKRGHSLSKQFQAGRGHLIGTSGTVTSLCAVHKNLRQYMRSVVDGSTLKREEALSARARLLGMSCHERAGIPCIGEGRSDLILAGCAILDAVWELWPSDTMRVADRGLREGMLLSLMYGKPTTRRRNKRKKPDAEGEGNATEER